MSKVNGQRVVIIDRTLPELLSAADKMSRLDILDFCWMLKNAGVDIIEADTRLISKLGKLPQGLDFLLEVESIEDLHICKRLRNRSCVLKPQLLLMDEVVECIREHSLHAELDITASSIEDLYGLEMLSTFPGIQLISGIRLTGLGRLDTTEWVSVVKRLKGILEKKIDICPAQTLSMGNAILLEAALNGMEYVTATFTGYGQKRKYASTEILLTALKVLYGDARKSNLQMLPDLRELFARHVHEKIPDNTPVIGKHIFMYESGIHADGIDKDPNTYEPYDPAIVGQKRKLVIGKHSGRLSIAKKLAELGMEAERADMTQLLQEVKELSVQMNRSLDNEEIMDAYTRSCLH